MHSEAPYELTAARAQSIPDTTDRPACAAPGRGRLRLWGAVAAAACAGALMALQWLTPWKEGLGTHRQLGLPACSFLVQTGYPCPTCGMTTSVAAAAHGRFVEAFLAQPFGLVPVAAMALVGLAGAVQAVSGRASLAALKPRWWHVGAVIGALLVGWGVKILIGVHTGRLPV